MPETAALVTEMDTTLERLKWYLWHGNVLRALQLVEDLEFDLDELPASPEQRKVAKAVRELSRYIRATRAFIPNYGERYRYGEAISTAFVESTVNQVISKRMVKKQQMRWTRRGANNVLQIRTRVLDGEFCATFARWYPGMQPAEQEVAWKPSPHFVLVSIYFTRTTWQFAAVPAHVTLTDLPSCGTVRVRAEWRPKHTPTIKTSAALSGSIIRFVAL